MSCATTYDQTTAKNHKFPRQWFKDEQRALGGFLNVTNKNSFPNLQENSRVGDRFMNQIEPMAAYVPYMTCPGNHEEAW